MIWGNREKRCFHSHATLRRPSGHLQHRQMPTHVLVSEQASFIAIFPWKKRKRNFYTVIERKGGEGGTEGEEETFISLRPPSLFDFAANQQEGSLPLATRSSAQAPTQPALCGVTKCSSCHPRETKHICSEMFSAFPDLGHGNLRTFPNPGLISLIQLDY